jgi:RND family efflux transporter MFP subunit
MKKQYFYLFLLVIFCFQGCKSKKSDHETSELSTAVITEKTARTVVKDVISLSGNIEGYKTIKIGFIVAGRINYMAIDEGQFVSKGQLVASLDPSSYSIAKELADIQVKQVEDEYERLKLMFDNKSLSESDFVKITTGLQQAKAQQKLHEKNLAETKLYSPINGVLLKKLAEVGEITGVGMPVLIVSEVKKVKINAFVPESELNKIKIGQRASVKVNPLDTIYEGRIIEVGSAADPSSRSFPVKVELENPGLLMRPGMIAEVSTESDLKLEILTIPADAILHDYNNQSYVFVVDTAKNLAFRRNVSPGKIYNDRIEIASGLNDGEVIVTGGQHKLIDGSLINISK